MKSLDEIGFAAAIWPDDAGYPRLDQKFRRLDKSLEARDAEFAKFHRLRPSTDEACKERGDRFSYYHPAARPCFVTNLLAIRAGPLRSYSTKLLSFWLTNPKGP